MRRRPGERPTHPARTTSTRSSRKRPPAVVSSTFSVGQVSNQASTIYALSCVACDDIPTWVGLGRMRLGRQST